MESPPLVNDAIAASIETTSIKPSVKTSTPQVAHERKSNRNISQIEHSRHRNAFNFAVNLMTELIAYTYQEKKLSLHLDPPKCGKGAQTVPERAVWGGIAKAVRRAESSVRRHAAPTIKRRSHPPDEWLAST